MFFPLWYTFLDLIHSEVFFTIYEPWQNLQNTNFWGPVYATHFAIPHLKKTKGKIIAVASPAGWSGVPRMSIYAVNASSSFSFSCSLN